MNNYSHTKENRENFLEELAELSHKYGIVIEGCGCCGSPYLNETLTENEFYKTGHYEYYNNLEYIIQDKNTLNDQFAKKSIKDRAYEIDPECWISYSGKEKKFKQLMDKRRNEALLKARKEALFDE